MHKSELLELSQRLTQLADALGGKAPTQAGLLVWGDALNECRFDDVKAALSDWPKTNYKMPVPAEILKVCRSEVSRRIEEEAKRNAANAPTLRDVEREAQRGQPTMTAKEALAQIKRTLARPRPGPKDWAYKLKDREKGGEQLDVQQRRLWREALRETA
jgi:hypothetical protein